MSADYAAALSTADRGGYEKAKTLIDRAERAIQAYIKTTQREAYTKTRPT